MNTSNSSKMWKGAVTNLLNAIRKHSVVEDRSPPDSVLRFCKAERVMGYED